jgi:hypothetical protein
LADVAAFSGETFIIRRALRITSPTWSSKFIYS